MNVKAFPYKPEVENSMKFFFNTLPENMRRRYAAVEALKLPHGGQGYISRLLNCDPKTILRGIREIESGYFSEDSGIRQKGGGRKRTEGIYPHLKDVFLEVVDHHIAGDPMNEHIKWINLSQAKIRDLIAEYGIMVDPCVVSRLLKDLGFLARKMSKKKQ